MKLDKETLAKYQFWFLLGSYLVVWVIAVFWLKVAASEPIAKAEKDWKDATQGLKTASQNPINEAAFCRPWVEYGKTFDGHKRVIWGSAWEIQKDMYDWPKELTRQDMSTPQTVLQDDERSRYMNDLYKAQIKELRELVTPPNSLLGPVELKEGFDEVIKPQEWKETPTREEMWLVQEDYWVKRELLYVIGSAILSQSIMYPVEIDEKEEPMPEGVLHRFRYRNQNWEVTLHIRKDDKGDDKDQLTIGWDSTIKNLHPSHTAQPLISAKGTGILFTLTQNVGRETVRKMIMVQGEPVPPDTAQVFDKDRKNYPSGLLLGIDWAKGRDKDSAIYLSQAFDESTCPIRRLDAIALGQQAQSCRTITVPLQPNEVLAKLDAPKEDPNANQGGAGMGGPGGGGMGSPGGPGMGGPGAKGMGGGPGAPGMAGAKGMGGGPGRSGMPAMPGVGGPGEKGTQTVNNPTPNNNIERNRYLHPPKKEGEGDKPSRHLPLAVQLIVEQSHMPDVLLAMANSRLRIQITQVEAHRAQDYRSQAENDKKDGSEMRTFQAPNMAMNRRPMPGPRSGPGAGPMPPPGAPNRRPPAGMRGGMASGGMYGMPSMTPGRGGTLRGTMQGAMNPKKIGKIGLPGMQWNGPMSPGGDSKEKKGQEDDNLVEMTVYGIATLYRLPDPETSESAGQPGQPAPGAQPGQPMAAPPPAGGKR